MIPPSIIAAVIVALVAFASGWKVNDWRRDSAEKEREQQVLADVRDAAKADLRRSEKVIEAQSAANRREADLRRAADGARSELDSLRALSDATLAASRDSLEACVERATAVVEVFKSCAGRYESLAEKTDRHVSDIQTLSDSWPK